MAVYFAYPPKGLERQKANEEIQKLIEFIESDSGPENGNARELFARRGVRISLDGELAKEDVAMCFLALGVCLREWDIDPKLPS